VESTALTSKDGRSANTIGNHSSFSNLSIETVLKNWKTIFKIKFPCWKNLQLLHECFKSNHMLTQFESKLDSLSHQITKLRPFLKTNLQETLKSLLFELEECVCTGRRVHPREHLQILDTSILQLHDKEVALSCTSNGQEHANRLPSQSLAREEFVDDPTQSCAQDTAPVLSDPKQPSEEGTSLKDFSEKRDVMKLFKSKDPLAMSRLWDYVNTEPLLVKHVYAFDPVPSRIFTNSCRTWINSTARPLLKCLRNHFQDDTEAFKTAFPTLTASGFIQICDGNGQTHPNLPKTNK
jgi:hypothetical protein